jgi:8-oxo-dGTP pyrophosphatase MutT (NUDIX family)
MSLIDFKEYNTKAVKAIIFRNDGCVLMQQSTLNSSLPFYGCWNFFGGLIDNEVTRDKAIENQLVKEFGSIPGQLLPQLFQWISKSEFCSAQYHFFPVFCEIPADNLILRGNLALNWFSLEELITIPLAPVVYENFSKIAKFLTSFYSDLISLVEKNILTTYDLIKKNDKVFYARINPSGLSRQQMFLLKELAYLRNLPLFRCCLHIDDQCNIHEMLMIHTKPNSLGPLKQKKTSLSYHIFEGSLMINMHDEKGLIIKKYFLGEAATSESGYLSLRLNAQDFRSIHSTSSYAIFLEVASGPFDDLDTIWMNKDK